MLDKIEEPTTQVAGSFIDLHWIIEWENTEISVYSAFRYLIMQ